MQEDGQWVKWWCGWVLFATYKCQSHRVCVLRLECTPMPSNLWGSPLPIVVAVPLADTDDFHEYGAEPEEPPAPTPPPQQPEASPALSENQPKPSWAGLVSRGGHTQAVPASQPTQLPAPPQVGSWSHGVVHVLYIKGRHTWL